MDLNNFAFKIDKAFHSLNTIFNPTYNNWSYGRGLEQASGLGLWFVSFTLLYSSYYGLQAETFQVNNFFLAWITGVMGFCQIYYNGRPQRLFFTLCSTIIWLLIAVGAFVTYGDFNLLTAASLPYCLSSFYIFGFLCGPDL